MCHNPLLAVLDSRKRDVIRTTRTIFLRFDSDYLDLESGIVDTVPNGILQLGDDLLVIRDGAGVHQSVIIQNPPGEIAILTRLGFSEVSVDNTDVRRLSQHHF